MLIDAVASSVGRRIDEIRIDTDRLAREQWEREIRSLATESELRALRAQLNPHFLFNALNTLGHLMQAAPDRALTTLYRLTALLRAVLRRTNGQFVSLREELEIVEAYLAIEHERFQERLTVSIDVPRELRQARIPPSALAAAGGERGKARYHADAKWRNHHRARRTRCDIREDRRRCFGSR